MIDKPLVIILFMYCMSVSYLTLEYTIVDVYHITVTNYNGEVLTGTFVSDWMQLSEFNTLTGDIVEGTFTGNTTFYNKVETFTTAAAAVAWNLITLLSGLYILNLILFLGVPEVLVIGIGILYALLLARSIIGYIRGI